MIIVLQLLGAIKILAAAVGGGVVIVYVLDSSKWTLWTVAGGVGAFVTFAEGLGWITVARMLKPEMSMGRETVWRWSGIELGADEEEIARQVGLGRLLKLERAGKLDVVWDKLNALSGEQLDWLIARLPAGRDEVAELRDMAARIRDGCKDRDQS